jgi:glyoxylase-like metal-dependent hydrolase (beta-lactamase superfamily II)
MKTTQHGSYLTQLTRWPLLFPVNVYLVREDDGLTLVDTGMPGSANAILAAADVIGLPITRIALTHGHSDHVGSLDALRATLPDTEVLMTLRTAQLLSGDRSQDADEAARGKLSGSWKTSEPRPTRTIAHGDRVGSLEVVSAPGHSPDLVAFFDTRDGTLIAGDAFQTRAGIAVSGVVRPLFPFPALATWHKPTALESATRLRGLHPSRLVVGHGQAINDPLAAMDGAISVAERKLQGQLRHAG